MVRKIIQKGSILLRTKSEPVIDFKAIQQVIDDLLDTINHLKTTHEFKRGVGLSAVQIGQSVRVSVVEIEGKIHCLINPQILKTSDKKISIREGCISFFEYRAQVPRFDYVKVKAFNREGLEYFLEVKGDSAMLLQHEIDHMDGILYVDHLIGKENDLILNN